MCTDIYFSLFIWTYTFTAAAHAYLAVRSKRHKKVILNNFKTENIYKIYTEVTYIILKYTRLILCNNTLRARLQVCSDWPSMFEIWLAVHAKDITDSWTWLNWQVTNWIHGITSKNQT